MENPMDPNLKFNTKGVQLFDDPNKYIIDLL